MKWKEGHLIQRCYIEEYPDEVSLTMLYHKGIVIQILLAYGIYTFQF